MIFSLPINQLIMKIPNVQFLSEEIVLNGERKIRMMTNDTSNMISIE